MKKLLFLILAAGFMKVQAQLAVNSYYEESYSATANTGVNAGYESGAAVSTTVTGFSGTTACCASPAVVQTPTCGTTTVIRGGVVTPAPCTRVVMRPAHGKFHCKPMHKRVVVGACPPARRAYGPYRCFR